VSREFDAYHDSLVAADDDLVAGWAGDAQARKRAHDVYGPATEAPDKVDELVLAEWRRRCALKHSASHEHQADQDVERDPDREAER
jgi:hypothetical protein